MKRFLYGNLLLLALPLCASCGSNAAPAPAKPAISSTYKTQQTDNIHEALLSSYVRTPTLLYYVSLGAKDPSDAFIQRMRRRNIRIQKMSLSPQPYAKNRGGTNSPRNPMLVVWPIRWLNPSRVELRVDSTGAGSTYTLAQKNGKWIVAARKRKWIS